MKLSDYIIQFLEKYGVRDIFLLAGGGIMHLLDSVAQSEKINKYYNLNEQATSFCADAYAQTNNKLGVCMVTTGPGATNAITGIASAHIDSSPVLVLSGQVRTNSMVGDTGARQMGAQEVDIISIVKPITKYAVTIMKAEEIRYHLEKAIYLAKHGRSGAVWLDIPLDIQAMQIQEETLIGFDPIKEGYVKCINYEDEIKKIYLMLLAAKRPVILAGSGVFFADATEDFARLVNQLKIPVLSSAKFKHIVSKLDKDLFYGSVRSFAPRYTNYILQNSDLLIVIGCGLRYYMTAFNDKNFAPLAKKININVDITEINKLDIYFDIRIIGDAKNVIQQLNNNVKLYHNNIDEWKKYCYDIKQKYPVLKEIIRKEPERTDIWAVYEKAKKLFRSNDVITTVCTSLCIFPYYLDFEPEKDQLLIQTCGLGAMGHGIPAAIATCIASGKRRTIMFEGDGALQHNIQELALISTYKLPIKLFIDSNQGYSQIYGMQNNHFKGRHAGCTPDSGVCFPNLEMIAKAYHIKYIGIKLASEIDEKVKEVLKDNQAVICEMFTPIDFPTILITKSRILEDGQMATSSLEDLYPFLPPEEHKSNMISRKS